MIAFSRTFSMPNAETFKVQPIAAFVEKYAATSTTSVDPFARNASIATYTNDIDTKTDAQYHMDAEAFLIMLAERGVCADLGIFDPPYSPRQISECYRSAGLQVGQCETQNAALYRRVRDALNRIMADGGIVLSFGWNSVGMGIGRGYRCEEIALVSHGGAHNDTICLAERKITRARKETPDAQ